MFDEVIVPPSTISVAQELADCGLTRHFVLGGGTSITLCLGHRISRDLDFLLPKQGLDIIESRALVTKLGTMMPPDEWSIVLQTPTQVDCSIRGVLVSWVGYPFEFVDPYAEWHGNSVISLLDAAAMKAYTIGRRPAARDYFDLYHIFKSGIEMKAVVDRARQIFTLGGATLFDGNLFAKQLTYTDDVDVDDIAGIERAPGVDTWETAVARLREVSSQWTRDRAGKGGIE